MLPKRYERVKYSVVNRKIVITFTRQMAVETVVAAHLLLAPDHNNVPAHQDFSADSCIKMLMSMI